MITDRKQWADPYEQWIYDLAEALGYTLDGEHPTIHNLPPNPFAFIEHPSSTEVVTYEVDGDNTELAPRKSRRIGTASIALRTIRRPLPEGFALVDLTTIDGATHRIALHQPSEEVA